MGSCCWRSWAAGLEEDGFGGLLAAALFWEKPSGAGGGGGGSANVVRSGGLLSPVERAACWRHDRLTGAAKACRPGDDGKS